MRVFRRDDLEAVNGWFSGHRQPPMVPAALPTLGLIEPGVAAGFLYETDSTMAMVEGYVTNPDAAPADRNAALDEITEALLDCAKDQRFKHVIAICRDDSIEKRAERHGFKLLGRYALMAREV
jgi:hypothetical protein